MVKRRFSGKRLYKLLKVIVIAITLLITIVLALSAKNVLEGKIFEHWNDTCEELYLVESGKYSREGYGDCLSLAVEGQTKSETLFFRLVGVAIGLPTIFFGGTWLYKYLVPLKKEKE